MSCVEYIAMCNISVTLPAYADNSRHQMSVYVVRMVFYFVNWFMSYSFISYRSSAARSGRSSHNNSFIHNNNTGNANCNNNNSFYQDNEGEGVEAYVERQQTWVEKK